MSNYHYKKGVYSDPFHLPGPTREMSVCGHIRNKAEDSFN